MSTASWRQLLIMFFEFIGVKYGSRNFLVSTEAGIFW
jgi:hypothetical protein